MAKNKTTVKLIPFPAGEEFIAALGAGVKKSGYKSRSEFIRDAIVEKFADMRVKFPAKLAQPPRVLERRAKQAKAAKAPVRKAAAKRRK